ncbi:MAG: hypothetical protein GY953_14345, partial [bacterium]|nr:hypothetical protein [bacterium]
MSDYWIGTYFLPQPFRYHLEVEMAFAVAFVFGAGAIVSRGPPPYRKIAFAAASVLAAIQFVNYRAYSQNLVKPIEIEGTIEYAAAQWLGENLPDGRVFATGSIQFWMNAFTDIQQVAGGAAQGTVNPTVPGLRYGILVTEGDGERSAMWLRVYGVDAIVVSGPNTRDA